MSYCNYLKEINELYEERLELVVERLAGINEKPEVSDQFADVFKAISSYLLLQNEVLKKAQAGQIKNLPFAEGKEYNERLYGQFNTEGYKTSYANPAYAAKLLGLEYGRLFSAIFACIVEKGYSVFEGNSEYLCIYCELIVEIYNLFESEEGTSVQEISECLYSFMHDYAEVFNENYINRMLIPEYTTYFSDIVKESDLTNSDFLYRYGLPVGEDEIRSREFLASLSDDEIQAMADTYTEGYRMGFESTNKNFAAKSVVEIRYPLGFERMVMAAMKNFKALGLDAVMRPIAMFPDKYMASVNKQMDFDHREDHALWSDKAYVEYSIECYRNALDKIKNLGPNFGGPAVIEVFGETPFSPESKKEKCSLSEEQQKLEIHQTNENLQNLYACIHGEDRSFTIIAYPVASIGEKYEEIFAETVKLNTLDYIMYRDMQQKIIDVLDTADRVHIVGTNGNKTDLYVKVFDLQNPEKETAFENCVADVNIPVGEVFTSPVLEGTNGKLHVSQVYLNELNYKNIEIDFKDGMITDYTCTNFDNEEDNKKYVADNVLFHHPTLAMGEFAIGTNTTAYKMARVYEIADKMPILIAEKTGPHFAVGDTCYTHDEDNITYNSDGKMIVARDNSVSILRKEDPSKAYFGCHTDITIPYDELGAITVLGKDGSEIDIIRNGRFVLPGVEELNRPLDELAAMS